MRETLIDLGETAIRTHGFGGFSYADLAREAGIKKASIHHHFPAKADLGLAVLERYAERLEQAMNDIGLSSETGAERLANAVQLYRDALGDASTVCLCTALAGDGERLSEAMLDRLAATNRMVTAWLENVLSVGERDGSISDPARAAPATLAQLQGAQLMARAARDITLFDSATIDLSGKTLENRS